MKCLADMSLCLSSPARTRPRTPVPVTFYQWMMYHPHESSHRCLHQHLALSKSKLLRRMLQPLHLMIVRPGRSLQNPTAKNGESCNSGCCSNIPWQNWCQNIPEMQKALRHDAVSNYVQSHAETWQDAAHSYLGTRSNCHPLCPSQLPRAMKMEGP